MRLLEEDHALGDPPREDVVPDGAALEHLAVDDLVGLAQVAQDDAAVARVPRVDDVEHVEHLDMEGEVTGVSWVNQLKRLRESSSVSEMPSKPKSGKFEGPLKRSLLTSSHIFLISVTCSWSYLAMSWLLRTMMCRLRSMSR